MFTIVVEVKMRKIFVQIGITVAIGVVYTSFFFHFIAWPEIEKRISIDSAQNRVNEVLSRTDATTLEGACMNTTDPVICKVTSDGQHQKIEITLFNAALSDGGDLDRWPIRSRTLLIDRAPRLVRIGEDRKLF